MIERAGTHGAPDAADREQAQPAAPQRATSAPSRRGATKAGFDLGVLVQAKLTVGPANDPFEREADDVAAQVVRSLRSSGGRIRRSTVREPAERAPATARRIQPMADARPEPVPAIARRIQRMADIGPSGGDLDDDTARALRASRAGGRPLAEPVRSTMETAFGADFGGVRVHVGATSNELNNRIQAKAFTTGNDIYFRDGLPDIGSSAGQTLLAHELTHTIQQGAAVHGAAVADSAQRMMIQRVFDAATPSTYDDGDGSHALAEHGPLRPESEHQARAKSNSPSYASSGWASEDMMKTAVTRALATRSATGAKLKRSPNAQKFYARWTVNVTLAKCGYTWKSNNGSDPVTKTESNTGVVIFAIDKDTGNVERMVTAYPGDHAKEFNATA
jgi:hypothetical protein